MQMPEAEEEEVQGGEQKDDNKPRWQKVSQRVCNRLKMEGATNRTLDSVECIFKAAVERGSNPIDYNIF